MPLQKLPPKGLPSLDQHGSQRRQQQERRRTLQTISELSATDVPSLRFKVVVGTGQSTVASRSGMSNVGVKTSAMAKRRSLPQYCTRPECTDARSTPPLPPLPSTITYRSKSGPNTKATSSGKPETGWNARRERARLQAERDLAGGQLRREISGYKLQVGSSSNLPTTSPLPAVNTQSASIRHSSSQQHLLRNSRSMSGMSSRSERRSSLGSTHRYTNRPDHDTDSSDRTSDSSSYNSPPGNVQRNRSGSSGSTISHHTLPMSASVNTPIQGFHDNLHHRSGAVVNRPQYYGTQAMPTDRAWSMPVMSMNYTMPYYITNSQSTNPHSQTRSQPGSRRSRHDQQQQAHFSTGPSPAASISSRHKSPSSSSSQRSRTPSEHRRSLPQPIHSPPPPAYTANAAIDQTDKTTPQPSPPIKHEQRSMPKRESLTQWKNEREEAKAEFDGIQRAKMRERVRRANELEQQKERELRLLGKGMANEKACRVLGRDVDGEMMEKAGEGGARQLEIERERRKEREKERGMKRGEKERKEEEGCFGGLFGGLFGRRK